MRVERLVFLGSAFFLLAGAIGYAAITRERVGTVMLGVSGLAWLLLWGFLSVEARNTGERPEDREDATAADSAGTIGWFPHTSVWPLVMGVGAWLVGLGLVYGPWFSIVGGLVLGTGVIGLAIESERRTPASR